jgi:CRP-like cAMP-binding protein
MNCLTCSMFFKSSNLCAHLDGEELCKLNRQSRTQTLKRGEALNESMLKDWPVLAISGGVLGIKHLLDDGRRTIAAFFMEGDIIDLRRRSIRMRGSLVALTKVELCRLSPGVFEEIIAANPDAQRLAWENLREQINRALYHSADLGKKQALEKLASFIFECQYRQAGNKVPGKTVKIPIRRCDMAEYLGLQPETVSRGFRELQDRKIISFRNSSDIEITRLPCLKRIANGGQAGDATVRQNDAGMKVLSFS